MQKFTKTPLNMEEIEQIEITEKLENKKVKKAIAISFWVAFLLAIIIYTSLALYIQNKNNKIIEELQTKIEVLQKPTQILNNLWDLRNKNLKDIENAKIVIHQQQEKITISEKNRDEIEAKIRCQRKAIYTALNCEQDWKDFIQGL